MKLTSVDVNATFWAQLDLLAIFFCFKIFILNLSKSDAKGLYAPGAVKFRSDRGGCIWKGVRHTVTRQTVIIIHFFKSNFSRRKTLLARRNLLGDYCRRNFVMTRTFANFVQSLVILMSGFSSPGSCSLCRTSWKTSL